MGTVWWKQSTNNSLSLSLSVSLCLSLSLSLSLSLWCKSSWKCVPLNYVVATIQQDNYFFLFLLFRQNVTPTATENIPG